MNHKVLLADDSLTIQKVIKITLANQPYDIVDCSTDEDLLKKLPEIRPRLVLLDFNLSEKYTGYELTAKIKDIVPEANVLLLLGTFDSVDDAAMEKCGAADKVVKPFDSNKFIAICKRLTEFDDDIVEAPLPFSQSEQKEEVVASHHEEDDWQVSHVIEETTLQVENEKDSFDPKAHLNPLDQEISDWGMSVPGVIGGAEDDLPEMPPVIGVREDSVLPSNSDLDYPVMDKTSPSTATSKLISIDTFKSDAEFEIEHKINSIEETDVSTIEKLIADEVEEDLWKVDEFEDLKKEVSSKIEEVKNNFQPTITDFDESLFKPLDDSESIEWTVGSDKKSNESAVSTSVDVDLSTIRLEIEQLVKKHVKEYMDDMFKKNVEKVAWEVIPDLAENLIRQELSAISKKILTQSENS